MYDPKLLGVNPHVRDLLFAQAKFNAGDIEVVVQRANVTPAPTTEAWSYEVPFQIQTAAGEVIPFTGDIAASGAETTAGGGTADPDDTTPAVVMGYGTVTFAGTAGTWANADTATLTLTYTDAYGVANTDTFVVTFTTP